MKKHVSQMTNAEQKRLLNLLMAVPYWKAGEHCSHRLSQRRGKLRDARDVVFNGDLIEYHNKNGSHRVLLRGSKVFRGRVMCAVFEIDTCKIITHYWNDIDDNHNTIDMSAYNKDLNILKLLCN